MCSCPCGLELNWGSLAFVVSSVLLLFVRKQLFGIYYYWHPIHRWLVVCKRVTFFTDMTSAFVRTNEEREWHSRREDVFEAASGMMAVVVDMIRHTNNVKGNCRKMWVGFVVSCCLRGFLRGVWRICPGAEYPAPGQNILPEDEVAGKYILCLASHKTRNGPLTKPPRRSRLNVNRMVLHNYRTVRTALFWRKETPSGLNRRNAYQ